MITFYDAKQYLAEYVRTGLCPDHPDVAKDINDACMRLLQVQDSLYSLDIIRIWTQNNSISLPRGYISARMLRLDHVPRPIQSIPYEFLEYGPGNIGNSGSKLVEEGIGHPTFFKVPQDKSYGLFAASSVQDDELSSMQLRCIFTDGSDYRVDGSPDVTIPIKFWDGGSEGALTYVPTNQLSAEIASVTQVVLPEGLKGYISFYAIDPDTGSMWFLSRYHPDETRPGYRRYRLPVFNNGTGFGSSVRGTDPADGTFVECLCKKEHVKMTRDNDMLSVQNLTALKFMVKAIHLENHQDLTGAVGYKQMALENVQLQESDQTKGEVFNFGYQNAFSNSDVNII